MAPGGFQDSSQHASVISVRFCGPRAGRGLVILVTLGLKVVLGRPSKIDRKSTLCEKRGAEESTFVDFGRLRRFSHFSFRFSLDFE